MASKQLGKLRQWAGEVMTSKEKSTFSDDFLELQKDVERRKDGAHRLFLAGEAYHRGLSKRKENTALDDSEKLLPIETLGIVMVIFGEEFGDDSPFGTSLISLGRAQCKVAKFQESYAESFADNFMASLVRFAEEVKEYEALRKKLDSKRLSYDASVSKYEKLKNSKKDKERKDAEDEMEHARTRYEETMEEVEAHMHAIQENETSQLRELTNFLTHQITFVENYLDVLKETRDSWPENVPARKHSFSKQHKPVRSLSKRSTAPAPPPRPSSSSEEDDQRPGSRAASRSSRKRSDSTGTAGGEKDKDKRRLSVAGWASSAVASVGSSVGSVAGRGRKSKDKETFASLTDDAEGRESPGHGESDTPSSGGGITGSLHALTRRKSASSAKNGQTTPKLPARMLKPPSAQNRKVVRALYDFTGAADELSFRVGDTIVVINEVLDGWWMGELNGKQGLFPTPYTEPLPDRPPLPRRPTDEHKGNGLGLQLDDDWDEDRRNGDDTDDDDLHEHYGHPMGILSPTTNSPFYDGPSDAASIVSSLADDEATTPFSPGPLTSGKPIAPPPMPRRSTTSDLTPKKAPPPPPPRRTTNTTPSASPRIPDRRPPSRPTSASGRSGGGGGGGYLSASASVSSESSSGYDRSPFESATEFDSYGPSATGCREFKQNPFKPKGMCSNCFGTH
ncbi:BAR domain-containing protein [Mycena kentingensis (nom. inval.)]|nr:BAR domain-containing protein [Mycena kentingensis (nom. inval.)]